MLTATILGLSIVLQFAAGGVALSMARGASWRWPWLMLTAAIVLMGVRRSISFYRLIESGSQGGDLTAELVALAISVLMLGGISFFAKTQRRAVAAEAAVREKTDLLMAMLEHMDAGISMVDANLIGVATNQRFYELLGYPADEFPVGTPYEDFIRYNAMHGDYGPGDVDELVRERVEQAKRFEPHRFERALSDGKFIEVRGNPVPGGGFVTSYTDITERKLAETAIRESEGRFRAFIENTPSAILLKDVDGGYILANQTWHAWFNPQGREISGKTVFDFYTSEHAEKVAKIDQSVVETGTSSRVEVQTPFSDGSERTTLLQKFPIFDPEGAVVGIGSLNTDISEFIAAKKAAEYADRTKSEFLANMSHELRTPLNAIIGFTEMMTHQMFGPLGDRHYDEYSGDILESASHLLSLINDILDISKIESGQAELDETELNVAQIVQNCMRLVDVRSKEAGLTVRINVGDSLPALKADERLLKQMLLNLLSNAIKFTERGGEVSIDGELANDGVLRITVTDTGLGIAKTDISKAMSTFGQVDGALDRRFEGTGLGLPLVKSLAELHDGGFEIQSEVGIGTRATIWFPKERVVSGDRSSSG